MLREVARYSWTDEAAHQSLESEVRIGGWILGQTVASVPGGTVAADTTNWAGGKTNDAGVGDPTVYVRAKFSSGQFSAASSTTFGPRIVPNDVLLDFAMEDQGGSGWDGTLTNLTRSGGALIFSGSNLSGTYELDAFSAAGTHWVYAQAFCVAEQTHPATWGKSSSTWGGVTSQGWTWEGGLFDTSTTDERGSNGTLRVDYRSSISSSVTGDYKPFKSGPIFAQSLQLRVTMRRPSTDYQSTLSRMCVRLTAVPPRTANAYTVEVNE